MIASEGGKPVESPVHGKIAQVRFGCEGDIAFAAGFGDPPYKLPL
jgi:hypothetical protein